MHVSAVRLASILSSRLNAKVPAPFEFRADGPNFIVDHPDGWGLTMPLAWIEASGEDRSGSELAELIVGNALNSVQDAVSESRTEPWPALEAQGTLRTMAPYGTRCDGLNIYLWYGPTEADPTISFAPIPLADVAREESAQRAL